MLTGSTFALEPQFYGKRDITSALKALPTESDNVISEVRLIDNGDIGIRVFRVYDTVAQHISVTIQSA
jgi:hypothetical protein